MNDDEHVVWDTYCVHCGVREVGHVFKPEPRCHYCTYHFQNDGELEITARVLRRRRHAPENHRGEE